MDPRTQRKGVPMMDNCNTYNSHFWRFKSNIFRGDLVQSNHMLQQCGKVKKENNIFDGDCTLIHSENKWTEVTRAAHGRKNGKHPINLNALPIEKKIQPLPHLPPTNDHDMDVKKMNPARHRNRCRIILDSGASVNVFTTKIWLKTLDMCQTLKK